MLKSGRCSGVRVFVCVGVQVFTVQVFMACHEKTDRKRTKWWPEREKSGLAEGGPVVRWSPNPQPHQHQHRQKWRVEARRSVPEGREANGPRRVGPLSPGLGVQVRFWGFGLFGFRKCCQNTRIGQSRFGQSRSRWVTELAKVGLSWPQPPINPSFAVSARLRLTIFFGRGGGKGGVQTYQRSSPVLFWT